MRLSDIRASKGSSVPVASVADFPIDELPSGYLFCDGSPVSRASYARLFAKIGVTYGSGDGSTTFNLPDYRGYVRRGLAGEATTDPDKTTRTDRGDGTTGNNVGTKQTGRMNDHTHTMHHTHMWSMADQSGFTRRLRSLGESDYTQTEIVSFQSDIVLSDPTAGVDTGSTTIGNMGLESGSASYYTTGVLDAPIGEGADAETNFQYIYDFSETRMINVYVKPAIKY